MFVCFAYQELAPLWAVWTILVREFLVMGLRCFAAAENVVIQADTIGGLKIIATFLCILAILVNAGVAQFMLILTVVLTVVSGVSYFYTARQLLTKHLYYSSIETE